MSKCSAAVSRVCSQHLTLGPKAPSAYKLECQGIRPSGISTIGHCWLFPTLTFIHNKTKRKRPQIFTMANLNQ